jgi:hypothetical protein
VLIATHQVAFSQALFRGLGDSGTRGLGDSGLGTRDGRAAVGASLPIPLCEIDRNDVLAEARAKLCDWHMLRIGLVGVECRAIAKDNDERRVI